MPKGKKVERGPKQNAPLGARNGAAPPKFFSRTPHPPQPTRQRLSTSAPTEHRPTKNRKAAMRLCRCQVQTPAPSARAIKHPSLQENDTRGRPLAEQTRGS